MPKMTFVKPDGSRLEVEAPEGLSVMELAHKNDIDLEGACEGALACSTCHVIVDDKYFDLLPEASEDEEDMLDLAFGLTHTSRCSSGSRGTRMRACDSVAGKNAPVLTIVNRFSSTRTESISWWARIRLTPHRSRP